MAVRCSAKQIADFVVLLGMTGTIPEYCENADDAQKLKSLDLIISTLNIFVEAFDLYFEDIYRKYKVNFPLSEEKFIKFLKPRCLLLTKDNGCFNFILVCAFVFEMIHSFSHYNKCFHLVKVASKCLAVILQNRFKKIFETDSVWEELMSFCIKMHGLVYPPADKCESDDRQLVGVVTHKTNASFCNTAQELVELSIEKYVTDYNNDDYSNTKTTSKKSYMSFQSDLTSEIKEKELEDLSSSAFPTSSPVQTLQLAGEGSSKSENKENAVENNRKKDNEKDYVKDTLLDSSKEFLNVLSEKMSIRNNATEKPEKNFTRISEGYLANKTEAESSKDLCTIELPSTDTLQNRKKKKKSLKVKDFSPKKAENKGKIHVENNARNNNEKDSVTEMTDPMLPEFIKEFTDIYSKQTVININQLDNQKLDQITEFKKNIILPFEDYLAVKKVLEKVENFCNLGLSTDASHTLQQKIGDLSPKEENKEKSCNENISKQDNEENCKTNMTNSSLSGSTKESNYVISGKTVINNDNEKLHEMIGFKKNSTLSHEVYLAIKKVLERLEDLCFLGLSSTDVSHTIQLKIEELSPKEENVCNEYDDKKGNDKEFSTGTTDSSLHELANEFTDMVGKQTTNNNKTDNERLGHITISKKNIILSFEDYLEFQKVVGKLEDLCNVGLSSTGVSHKLQSKVEDSPAEQAEDKEKIHDGNDTRKDNGRDYATDLAALHESTKISPDVVSEKATIKNNKDDNEKLDEMTGFKKNLTLSYEDYSAIKKVIERLEDVCNLGLSSTGALHTSLLKVEDSSPKDNKEKIRNENDGKGNNEKDDGQDMTVSLVSNLEESTNITINNKDDGIDTIVPMIGCMKSLIRSSKKELAIKKIPEMLQLRNLEPDSYTGESHTCINGKDFSPNAESEDNKMKGDESNGKENVTFSLVPNLTLKPTKTSIEKKGIDKNLKGAEKLGQMNSCRKKLSLPLSKDTSAQKVAKNFIVSHNLESANSTDARPYLHLKDENAEKMTIDESNAKVGSENATFSLVSDLAHEPTGIEKKDIDKNLKGAEKLGPMNSCRKKLSLPLSKDTSAQKVAKNLVVSHNLESDNSTDARPNLQLKVENADKMTSNAKVGCENATFSLPSNLAHERTEIEKEAIYKNLKVSEKPGQLNSCRKKLSLPLSKDSNAQKAAKKLSVSHNLESATSTDATPQLKDEKFSSKNIRNMSANEIRTCITDDSVHLVKVLKLLKKCEDIRPNHFSPDEYDVPISGADENVETEAGCGISQSSRNSEVIFKSYMKATLFFKEIKMANSIKRIFHEDHPSNGKSPHVMSDEVAYVYGNRICESDDPCCPSCDGGMDSFFDACVNNFNTKYLNNEEISDLFKPHFCGDSK